jgi:hypothetical protein
LLLSGSFSSPPFFDNETEDIAKTIPVNPLHIPDALPTNQAHQINSETISHSQRSKQKKAPTTTGPYVTFR